MFDRPAAPSAGLPADAEDGVQEPAFVTIDTESTLAASPIGWASLIESAKVQQIGSLNEPLARWQMPASHRDRSPIALPKSWTFETGVDHGNPGCIDGAWE